MYLSRQKLKLVFALVTIIISLNFHRENYMFEIQLKLYEYIKLEGIISSLSKKKKFNRGFKIENKRIRY